MIMMMIIDQPVKFSHAFQILKLFNLIFWASQISQQISLFIHPIFTISIILLILLILFSMGLLLLIFILLSIVRLESYITRANLSLLFLNFRYLFQLLEFTKQLSKFLYFVSTTSINVQVDLQTYYLLNLLLSS